MVPERADSYRWLRHGLVLAVAAAVLGCSESGGGRQDASAEQKLVQRASSEVEPIRVDQVTAPPLAPQNSLDKSEEAAPPAKVGATGPRKRPAIVTKSDAVSERTTEKIPGYAVPAEYLFIRSRNYPHAVVAITLPEDYERRPDRKYPLVIVFGGAGECVKAPRDGALAWMHYYKTDEAIKALKRPELTSADFRGLVKQSELDFFNRRLSRRPYSGVILACPYSPLLTRQEIPEFPDYEAFVIEELVPALEERYRVAPDVIGVDGVSMGGARAMYYGFKYPEVFSSIGCVQGALGPFLEVYRDLVGKNKRILKNRSIQLVTSDGDPMAASVDKMHKFLKASGIVHRYLTLTGPHDYIFNQGPGSLALLVFHDQVLSRKVTSLPR